MGGLLSAQLDMLINSRDEGNTWDTKKVLSKSMAGNKKKKKIKAKVRKRKAERRKRNEVSDMKKKRPSAGLSKAEKSRIAKRARSGKDVDKGNFDEVAAAAGGGEKGKRIAAAQMWSKASKQGVTKSGKIKKRGK